MLEPDLLARFSGHLKEALHKALSFTLGAGRDTVEPGDVLVGLLAQKGSLAAEVLHKSGVNLKAAEDTFRGFPTAHDPGTPVAPDLSPAVKRVLEKCVLTAHLHEHKYIGTEHLLWAVLEMPLDGVHEFLESQGMHLDHAREQVLGALKSATKFPELAGQNLEGEMPHAEADPKTTQMPQADARSPRLARDKRPRALEAFARELTAPDVAPTLDPVVGRDMELERLIHVLCRRTKNNPILLGEPGVGKTAIVEGLAQRLVAGEVPDILQGRKLYAVDLALMVAGTMYRGEFEARLKQLVDEAKQDKDAILFIDEIHNMVGAGSTSGSLDAANILKPALARGEIRCIGATTWAEYKKHIEPDAALERRYQPVEIEEPSSALAREMLEGLKQRYEDHHGVQFSVEALDAAVALAERYLTDRFFPDKAIDILDEAAALVNAGRRSNESVERLRSMDIAIEAAVEAKEQAVGEGNLDLAAAARADEERLRNEKKELERKARAAREKDRVPVDVEQILRVVARLSRVPLDTLRKAEHDQLRELQDRLAASVFGQEQAVTAVAETVKKARLGFADPRRPRASFLFVGPSGVGKTELARALARELFGKEDALVKLDMSEFAEGHSVSKLLGSPAGYVGFREGNRLTDTIRRHPHAVLLFDEFEKAHMDVQHLLLQALEDGFMNDATGKKIPFRHAYVILTSNVGSDFVNKSRLGFSGSTSEQDFTVLVKEQLADRFRPELLNRLDRIVIFQPLEKAALKNIIRRELEAVLARVNTAQETAYTVSEEVLDWLLSRQFDPAEGARAARHLIEREVIALLGEALMSRPRKKKGELMVSKDKLRVA